MSKNIYSKILSLLVYKIHKLNYKFLLLAYENIMDIIKLVRVSCLRKLFVAREVGIIDAISHLQVRLCVHYYVYIYACIH